MKRIELIGKYGKGKFALVDDADYKRLSQLVWRVHATGYVVRGTRKEGIYTTHRIHREVLGDIPTKMFVDHINGNKLDNRRKNLRVCSPQQNTQNQRPKTKHYKGLVRRKNRLTWMVKIKCNKKDIYLGDFKDSWEAAKAYNKAAKKYFGEYARLNQKS